MTSKTELEWSYQPAEFFEAADVFPLVNGELRVDAGNAVYTLTPSQPVERELVQTIRQEVDAIFQARQLFVHKGYTLNGPRVVHHRPDGKRDFVLLAEPAVLRLTGQPVDVRLTGASGRVISDTKAERIREQSAVVHAVAPKAAASPTLMSMLRSYSQAVTDPSDELVHLYEVYDAAAKHFGSSTAAQTALGIPRSEWQILKRLANAEPIRQGRHRGRQAAALRDAAPEELAEARRIARRIIEAFAATI